MSGANPHASAPLLRVGADPGAARLGLVLLHGRGGYARDILGLAGAAGRTDVAALAPEAMGNSWWPTSFLAPEAQLQPWLDSALAVVARAVEALEGEGLARERIALAGFSQGACLALEYAARTGGPLAAVAGFSGGLVGTSDAPGGAEAALMGFGPKAFDYTARLDGVPVYLGCHRHDPHIPFARVERSAEVLRDMGAEVETQFHPGAGHTITQVDLDAFRRLMSR